MQVVADARCRIKVDEIETTCIVFFNFSPIGNMKANKPFFVVFSLVVVLMVSRDVAKPMWTMKNVQDIDSGPPKAREEKVKSIHETKSIEEAVFGAKSGRQRKAAFPLARRPCCNYICCGHYCPRCVVSDTQASTTRS